jgi:hypothetical protein
MLDYELSQAAAWNTLACMWPLLFAVKTLAISRNNINVVLTEAKITRAEVKTIMRQTNLFGWSNYWLVNYYHRLHSIAQPH